MESKHYVFAGTIETDRPYTDPGVECYMLLSESGHNNGLGLTKVLHTRNLNWLNC